VRNVLFPITESWTCRPALGDDYEALHPYLGWLSIESYANFCSHNSICPHSNEYYSSQNYQSSFFVINVHEPYTTDAVYSDVPVDDNGFKYAQVIVGNESLVTDGYGIKTDSSSTLLECQEAPSKLIIVMQKSVITSGIFFVLL